MTIAILLIATALHCGYERWAVKTGQDAGSLTMNPVTTSNLAALVKLRSPLPKTTGKYPPQINHRLSHENQLVTIDATIIAYRVENDSDLHLVLSDGQRVMIAEIPDPGCMDNLLSKKGIISSPWINQVTAVRNAFLAKTGYVPIPWTTAYGPPFIKASIPVRITGAVFFDWPHAQQSAAKNAIEIHPILAMQYQ